MQSAGRAIAQTAVDFDALHRGNPDSDKLEDDGSGSLKIWRITDGNMVRQQSVAAVGQR
jgi:hypothetical protein